jgi:hypothetical protein
MIETSQVGNAPRGKGTSYIAHSVIEVFYNHLQCPPFGLSNLLTPVKNAFVGVLPVTQRPLERVAHLEYGWMDIGYNHLLSPVTTMDGPGIYTILQAKETKETTES